MATAALGYQLARVEPRARALDRRDEELSGGGDACHVRVELTELLLRERSPGAVPGAEHLTRLGDRESRLLQQRDGIQSLKDGRVVLAASAGPPDRRDQADLLVVAKCRALEAGRSGDLADADRILVRHRAAPLDLKRTSTVIIVRMDTPAQPFTCSLEGAELLDRIEAWREIVPRATTRGVENDRVVAVYPKDAQLLGRLRALVAAEAECCSFLLFDVEETPDAIVTELRLPEGMPDPVRARVVALFAG